MNTISTRKIWVSTNAWRGYEQPVDGVCGANDTGMWSDSPCKSNVREKELKMVKTILRKNNIKYKQTVGKTSNVFCVHFYICVSEENKPKAIELIEPLLDKTDLLYLC